MFSLNHEGADKPARLRLEGNLTIYEVAQAHRELLALLPLGKRDWQLDLGGLLDCDSAGAQLLVAFERQLALQGQSMAVINPSAQTLALFELLHLQALYPDILPARAEI